MSLLDIPKVPEEVKSASKPFAADVNTSFETVETEQSSCTIEAFSLQGEIPQPAADAWKETIGMFDGDKLFKELSEAGKTIRESQREN